MIMLFHDIELNHAERIILRYTVCRRSLVHSFKVSILWKLDKTSWTWIIGFLLQTIFMSNVYDNYHLDALEVFFKQWKHFVNEDIYFVVFSSGALLTQSATVEFKKNASVQKQKMRPQIRFYLEKYYYK